MLTTQQSRKRNRIIGNKSIVWILTRYSKIVVFFLISTGLTFAQSSNPIAEKTETDLGLTAPTVIPNNAQQAINRCKRSIKADVVALAQPIMLNRLGAAIPGGMLFALKRDTKVVNGQVQLRTNKRPRPIVLRANVGDCVTITLTNAIPVDKFKSPRLKTETSAVSLHVQGMEWVRGPQDDGSFVGNNDSSLAVAAPDLPDTQTYTLFARQAGTFLLYSLGDMIGNQSSQGLFGALNVEPDEAEWYRSQVSQQDLQLATGARTNR